MWDIVKLPSVISILIIDGLVERIGHLRAVRMTMYFKSYEVAV